jgi:hypothetical protein
MTTVITGPLPRATEGSTTGARVVSPRLSSVCSPLTCWLLQLAG